MADLEENGEAVRAFYDLALKQKEPEEAMASYVGSTSIQHNPAAADGPGPFIEFVEAHTIAGGDLVVTHSLISTSPDDRGSATVDIFRLEEGKVVEHWDVLQPVPETAANDNTVF